MQSNGHEQQRVQVLELVDYRCACARTVSTVHMLLHATHPSQPNVFLHVKHTLHEQFYFVGTCSDELRPALSVATRLVTVDQRRRTYRMGNLLTLKYWGQTAARFLSFGMF